ncbi:hypothetical protein LTR86_009803 [Recurvomyces mirabilis]|nr:hypothetical protein LTR86_009803 [Recurvomyces mirabilis]
MSKMEKFDKWRDQKTGEEWKVINAFCEDGAAPDGEGETYGIKNDPSRNTIDGIKTRDERDIGVLFHKVGATYRGQFMDEDELMLLSFLPNSARPSLSLIAELDFTPLPA